MVYFVLFNTSSGLCVGYLEIVLLALKNANHCGENYYLSAL